MFELSYFKSQENVLFITTLLTCASLLLASLEYVAIIDQFSTNGIFSWNILSSRISYQKKSHLKAMDFIFDYSSTRTILYLQILSCVLLPVANSDGIRIVFAATIIACSLFLLYRNIFGSDGSDQMNHIVIIALFLSFLTREKSNKDICLFFIAAQSVISYSIAGIAKILSRKWRSGVALFQIMNTKTYGHSKVANLLDHFPKIIRKILSWHIIIIEVLFPLTLIMPVSYLWIFIMWGILFHLYNAITMGLNNFCLSFFATYPCIIYINNKCIH